MNKFKKYFIVGLLSVASMSIIGCGSKKLDVVGDLNIEVSGSNGYGTATLVNTYSYEDDMDTDDMEGFAKAVQLEEAIEYEIVSDKENLSNGDEVEVEIKVDTDKVKKLGYKAKSQTVKFEVKGLKDPVVIDAFKDFEITFDGFAPKASVASLDSKTINGVDVSYSTDISTGIDFGDTIVVTAHLSNTDEYVLKEEKKEFKADNLDRYVTDLEEISDDVFSKMEKELQDKLNAEFADWENENLENMTLVGTYLLSSKEQPRSWNNNYVYLLYEVHANNDTDGSFTYYWYGRYDDVQLLSTGDIYVDYTDYTCPSSVWTSGGNHGDSDIVKINSSSRYSYYGYDSVEKFENSQILSQIDSYTYTQK